MTTMTTQEYEQAKKDLQDTHVKELNALLVECAKSNSPVNIGDIVKSNTEIILVDHIRYGSNFGTPAAIYSGVCLTKKLVPFKTDERGTVWQQYMTEHIPAKTLTSKLQ